MADPGFYYSFQLTCLMKNTTQKCFAQKQRGGNICKNRLFAVPLLLWMLVLLLPNEGHSQFYNVTTDCTTQYQDISATGTKLNLNISDNTTHDAVLPFDFSFYGVNYVTPALRIAANGYILFNATSGHLPYDGNTPLPAPYPEINPGGAIFPFYDYIGYFTGGPAGIYVQSFGSAPNRSFVIQWHVHITHLGIDPNIFIEFQIILYEGTNQIRFVYDDTFFADPPHPSFESNYGNSATIGLQQGLAPFTSYQSSYNDSTLLLSSNCILYSPTAGETDCTMACHPTNIGIPANCQPVLFAQDFLTTSYNCEPSLIISLMTGPTGAVLETGVDSIVVDGIDINGAPYDILGQSYVIKIMENSTDQPNACWNWHTFEDYIAPVAECRDADTVACYLPLALYQPGNIDDCSQPVTVHLLDSTFVPYSCSDDPYLLGRLVRSYYLTDGSGNQSNTCYDTLYLAPPSLDSINWPENATDLVCSNTYLLDSNGHPHPDETGVPTIGADSVAMFPNTLGILCNLYTSYTDQVIPAGCNIKIMRTWTVQYWSCGGELSDVWVQTIMINDTTPPEVQAPADVTISASTGCNASFLVPPATVTDDCNHTGSVVVTHPNGVTPQNGGFIINNLGVGTHVITYSVNDGCGHIVTDQMTVTVVDNTSPHAICKDGVIVALTNNGTARMYASSVNNNSHDNGCGPVTVKVKRMFPDCNGDDNPQSEVFADYIDFYCCDLGDNPIPVILEVTDASGLKNTCMTTVTVQNKNVPSLQNLLPNIEVSCGTDYDIDHLALTFGKYVQDPALREPIIIDGINHGLDGLITGVCALTVTELAPIVDISQCGNGSITRRFEFTDGGTFSQIISQVITFTSEGYEISQSDFYPPADTVIVNGLCNPVDIANHNFGGIYEPRLIPGTSETCRQLMVTFEDQVFSLIPDVCFKIIRRWTIIDWCLAEQFGNQYAVDHAIHFASVIKVMNNTAPVFEPHADVLITTLNCDGGAGTISTIATDDCGASGLKYTWWVDFNYSNSLPTWDANGNGNSFNITWPLGTHRVHFAVKDGCGNTADQYFLVTVENNKQPTPVLHNLFVDLMADLTVTLPARMFNSNSFGACPDSYPLTFAYSSDPADSLRTFDCSFGVDVAFAVPIYVFDANGLSDFAVTTLTLNDNITPCPDNLNTISGQLLTETNIGIPDIKVQATSGMIRHSDDAGAFRFNNVQPGTTYVIVPSEHDNPLNGVSTGDVIKIQNHLLGKKALETPYKIIAADVTEDQSLTVKDIVQIRKLILGKIDQFSSGKSWKFIDQAYAFEDPNAPLTEAYPEYIEAATDGAMHNLNFVGVKLGDVNGDFTFNLNDEVISSRQAVYLTTIDQVMQPGQTYAVTFSNEGFDALAGLQATFRLAEGVYLTDFGSNVFNINEDNIAYNGNMLSVSIHELTGNQVGEGVLTLYIVVDRPVSVSNAVALQPGIVAAEAYDHDGDPVNIKLMFVDDHSSFTVEQNRPNPFSSHTSIAFSMDVEDEVRLRIFDLNGRLLVERSGYYASGQHQIDINSDDLQSTGVLFYELSGSHGTVTKRMIRLQ